MVPAAAVLAAIHPDPLLGVVVAALEEIQVVMVKLEFLTAVQVEAVAVVLARPVYREF